MGALTLRQKATLAVSMWVCLARIVVNLRRCPLPEVVDRCVARPSAPPPPADLTPRRLSRASYRVLAIGPYRPRCLLRALVLLELLRAQGRPAVLVIGLPEQAQSKDAHAWVEVDGRDVGPPPGSPRHAPLVRYPEPPIPAAGGTTP